MNGTRFVPITTITHIAGGFHHNRTSVIALTQLQFSPAFFDLDPNRVSDDEDEGTTQSDTKWLHEECRAFEWRPMRCIAHAVFSLNYFSRARSACTSPAYQLPTRCPSPLRYTRITSHRWAGSLLSPYSLATPLPQVCHSDRWSPLCDAENIRNMSFLFTR